MQSSKVTCPVVVSLSLALLFAVDLTVGAAQEEAPPGVRNYTRVDATVACAGATPPEAMGSEAADFALDYVK